MDWIARAPIKSVKNQIVTKLYHTLKATTTAAVEGRDPTIRQATGRVFRKFSARKNSSLNAQAWIRQVAEKVK